MKKKKLTPMEILHKQKASLQAKSDELSGTIENRFNFLQQNWVPLLRNSLVESAIAKMPPQLQGIAGLFLHKEQKKEVQDSQKQKVVHGVITGIATIVPFFLKGKTGAILSIILQQITKRIVR
jgi:hypothetical protein